ncbi:KTSC domain-containing protein [Sinimarinibacterium sp. CAU 1509]|uniref:KTSC domain-containing protein n=1 Tax=Sinimarinibacterium sp. CAU 1509 TaxID=2562283 RepID=UPI0010AC7267|nr:KTSC domain-containing protein [Sinimarinibacterium sp. CAU 1509]TJY57180.1 KTSC domain-containing protein [Sinimarinibacterium sp. CAU 1509]
MSTPAPAPKIHPTVILIDRAQSKSPVTRIAYAVESATLEVQFRGDKFYQYALVDYPTFHALCHADSVGGAVRSLLKAYPRVSGPLSELSRNAVSVHTMRRRDVPTQSGYRAALLAHTPAFVAAVAAWDATALFG